MEKPTTMSRLRELVEEIKNPVARQIARHWLRCRIAFRAKATSQELDQMILVRKGGLGWRPLERLFCLKPRNGNNAYWGVRRHRLAMRRQARKVVVAAA